MAVNSILPPYPIFADSTGEPLEGGYIYVGEPGFEARSTPKTSFFDKLLTIPTGTSSGAAVRTIAGFPARNGSPAMIYADEDYSLTVTDKNGKVIYTTLNRTFAFGVEVADIAPILAPDGNFANTGFGFINEQNTGRVRSSTGVVQDVVLGALVSQQSATGTLFTLPVSGAGFVEGVTTALSANLTQLSGLNRTRGDIIRGGASAWEDLALGASGQVLVSNGTDVVYYGSEQGPTTASGTAVNFASIPANANRIQIIINNVTFTTAEEMLIQIGTGGAPEVTGYDSSSVRLEGGTVANSGNTTAFNVYSQSASVRGIVYLERIPGGNVWAESHSINRGSGTGSVAAGGGTKSLAGSLDYIRVKGAAGVTFSGGTISIRVSV